MMSAENAMSSNTPENAPTAVPAFSTKRRRLASSNDAPIVLLSLGCACNHFSTAPALDSFALWEVLYNAKKPRKQQQKISVYMIL